MRLFLCLALILAAVSLTTVQPPASGCFDPDHDGVCYPDDCDNMNPFASFEDGLDEDGDGVTLC